MAIFQDDLGAAVEAPRVGSSTLLPEGVYAAQVVESEVKRNSGNTGNVLSLTYEILEPGFEGQKVWHTINVKHEKETVQRIGQAELARLKYACGIGGQLTDTDMLHSQPHAILIVVDPERPNPNGGVFKERNSVKEVAPWAEAETIKPGDGQTVSQPAPSPAPAAATPAWNRPATAAAQPPAPTVAAPTPAAAPAAANTPPWMKRAA
jgi:hypothetical protein